MITVTLPTWLYFLIMACLVVILVGIAMCIILFMILICMDIWYQKKFYKK